MPRGRIHGGVANAQLRVCFFSCLNDCLPTHSRSQHVEGMVDYR